MQNVILFWILGDDVTSRGLKPGCQLLRLNILVVFLSTSNQILASIVEHPLLSK